MPCKVVEGLNIVGAVQFHITGIVPIASVVVRYFVPIVAVGSLQPCKVAIFGKILEDGSNRHRRRRIICAAPRNVVANLYIIFFGCQTTKGNGHALAHRFKIALDKFEAERIESLHCKFQSDEFQRWRFGRLFKAVVDK